MIESRGTLPRFLLGKRQPSLFEQYPDPDIRSMATITVEVVSKKLIRPSNPTPQDDLGNLKLSLFDQLAPYMSTPVLFYYLNSEDGGITRVESAKRIAQLEKSLSQTLTLFYPLAGRFPENDDSIHCGDQGVECFQAQVNAKLAEFLQKEPQVELLNKFLPGDSPTAENYATSPLLAIQINSFDCGGIVIGTRFSHIIADASTILRFMSDWATYNRTGIDQVVCPSSTFVQFASVFPARQSLWSSINKLVLLSSSKDPKPAENGGELVARRFLFDETVISNIRDQAASFLNYKPTRVEVVFALISKALIGLAQVKHGQLRNSMLALTMNVRGKESLQLPELQYGNFWIPVLVIFLASEAEMELHYFISLFGNTFRDTKEKLANASCEEISSMLINSRREVMEKLQQTNAWDVYLFTSWCRFQFYEADFGWGKPFWFSTAPQSCESNYIMDARNGYGIEAWINLRKKDMLEFEKDADIQVLMSRKQKIEP